MWRCFSSLLLVSVIGTCLAGSPDNESSGYAASRTVGLSTSEIGGNEGALQRSAECDSSIEECMLLGYSDNGKPLLAPKPNSTAKPRPIVRQSAPALDTVDAVQTQTVQVAPAAKPVTVTTEVAQAQPQQPKVRVSRKQKPTNRTPPAQTQPPTRVKSLMNVVAKPKPGVSRTVADDPFQVFR